MCARHVQACFQSPTFFRAYDILGIEIVLSVFLVDNAVYTFYHTMLLSQAVYVFVETVCLFFLCLYDGIYLVFQWLLSTGKHAQAAQQC